MRQFCLSLLLTLLGLGTTVQPAAAQMLLPRALEFDSAQLEREGVAVAQDALQLVQFQQLDEALMRAKLATQLAPGVYETWALLGGLYLSLNQPDKSVPALERALSLNKTNPGVYFNLGAAYFRQGNYANAAKLIEQGLVLKPNVADELFNLGNSYLKLGQFPRAVQEYRKAIAQDKKFWPAINNIGLIQYEQGDKAGAVRSWQQAISMDSKAGEPKLALAAALYSQGRREQALPLAEAALRSDARYAEVSFLRENLWGERLIADAKVVLSNPKIQATIAQLQQTDSPRRR